MKRIICFLIILIFLSCEASMEEEFADFSIKAISPVISEKEMPISSEYQVNIELSGILSDESDLNSISYKWQVEYINLDIDKRYSVDFKQKNVTDSTSDSVVLNNNEVYHTSKYLNNYFLDVDNESSLALLSVYKKGFYKISLIATNYVIEDKYSIILQVGDVEYPQLYFRTNIISNDLKKDDYKGEFYYEIQGDMDAVGGIRSVDLSNIKDEWYNTGIRLNPMKSFNIVTGSHYIVKNDVSIISGYSTENYFSNSDEFIYSFGDISEQRLSINPIVFTNIERSGVFTLERRGNIDWVGELFISYLSWGLDKSGEEKFYSITDVISPEKSKSSLYFDNRYLAKVFFGSMGHRALNGDYYVYYSTEGTGAGELDPYDVRPFANYPYGYLIGRLGKEGAEFGIGSSFNYSKDMQEPLYYLLGNEFIIR